MRIIQSLLIQGFFWKAVTSYELDIHLAVRDVESTDDLCPFLFARASNDALKQMATSPGDEIVDFVNDHVPHVSLYLTDFDLEEGDDAKKQEIINAVTKTIVNLPIQSCQINLDGTFSVHSGYAIWNVELTPCLQKLSDSLVEATGSFVKKNQKVPSWVWNLPEPQRSEKVRMVEKYGSPNVFAGFQPHLTVGYNTKTTEEQKRQIMNKLKKHFLFHPKQPNHNCQGSITKVGLGTVGESGGTVLDRGLIKINFNQNEIDIPVNEIPQEE